MKIIGILIRSRESEVFRFKPGKPFYSAIGLNRKRWAMIYRAEIEPTVTELIRICEYFKWNISEVIQQDNNLVNESVTAIHG